MHECMEGFRLFLFLLLFLFLFLLLVCFLPLFFSVCTSLLLSFPYSFPLNSSHALYTPPSTQAMLYNIPLLSASSSQGCLRPFPFLYPTSSMTVSQEPLYFYIRNPESLVSVFILLQLSSAFCLIFMFICFSYLGGKSWKWEGGGEGCYPLNGAPHPFPSSSMDSFLRHILFYIYIYYFRFLPFLSSLEELTMWRLACRRKR